MQLMFRAILSNRKESVCLSFQILKFSSSYSVFLPHLSTFLITWDAFDSQMSLEREKKKSNII